MKNGGAGVCCNTFVDVQAEGDHWSACPPVGTGCTGGADYGIEGGCYTVVTTGCMTP